MTEPQEAKPNQVAAFVRAFFYGTIIEMLAEIVRNLIAVLPDPFLDVAQLDQSPHTH